MMDERARHELFNRLEEVLGPTPAATLMGQLPPQGWENVATKQDVLLVKQDVALLKQELAVVEHRLRAEFHQALAAQTRTMIYANVGALVAVASLAFGAARLA